MDREKKLVLVVDDEASFREIMSAQLGAAGFDVVTASTSEEAIKKAEEIVPDLILMDIHLGQTETGTDVALTIKQNPKTRNLRISFLTSLKDPWPGLSGDNEKVAQEIGMDDFIQKTDDPLVIAEKVKKILAGESAAPAPAAPPTPEPVAPAPVIVPEPEPAPAVVNEPAPTTDPTPEPSQPPQA